MKKQIAALSFLCLLSAELLAPDSLAYAGLDDERILRPFAVNIVRTPPQPWPGYGIYLGSGMVITAAHVVGHAWLTRPSVLIAGQTIPADVIKEGEFDQIDLTLLHVDEQRLPMSVRLRRMPICQDPPWTGEDVVVVVPEAVAYSRIMSPSRLPRDIRWRFSTVISDVANTGNSGSGVFDAQKQCLLGIMSRKIQRAVIHMENGQEVKKLYDVAKYFVPNTTILKFIPDNSVTY